MSPPATAPHETAAPGEDRAKWLTLVAVSIAFFMLGVNNTLVNVALPTIQRAFDASTSSLEWIINGYSLTLAVLVVTMGKLGDLFGRKRLFLIGMAIFTLASLLSALAPSLNALVACRIVQGIGGAIVMPATLSLITATFQGRERATAISLWSAVGGLAIIAGPITAGLLVHYLSWRWIFFINVPASAIVFPLTIRSVRESRDTSKAGSVDYAGVATLTAALFAFTLALIEGQGWGWASGRILELFAATALFFLAFVIVENRQDHPMVEFGIFRSLPFTTANLINLVYLFGMYGLLFFMTLYMQGVLGYTPLQAGIRTLPLGLIVFSAPLGARLVHRFGARVILFVGLSCVSAALLLVSQRLTPSSSYLDFFPAFVLVGCGAGLVSSPSSNIAMNAVARTKAGVASGVLNMTRQLGSVFGVAVLGAVYAARSHAHITAAVSALPIPDAFKAGIIASGSAQGNVSAGLDPALAAMSKAAIQLGTVQAYNDALLIAGLVCAVGALVSLSLRSTRREAAHQTAPETAATETARKSPALS